MQIKQDTLKCFVIAESRTCKKNQISCVVNGSVNLINYNLHVHVRFVFMPTGESFNCFIATGEITRVFWRKLAMDSFSRVLIAVPAPLSLFELCRVLQSGQSRKLAVLRFRLSSVSSWNQYRP